MRKTIHKGRPRSAKPKRKRIRIEDLLARMPKRVKLLVEELTDHPRGKEAW
jgi:hypothetical protein